MGRGIQAGMVLWLATVSPGISREWHAPGFRHRARVPLSIEAGPTVMVPLPSSGVNPQGSLIVRDSTGRSVPAEWVSATSERRWAQVATQDEGVLFTAPLLVYFDYAGDDPPAGTPPGVDSTPWSLEVFRVSGVGIPDRWERMDFMRRQAGAPASRFLLDQLDSLARRQIGDNRALVEAQTYLQVVEGDRYRFGLRCRHSGFILLDGLPVASSLDEGDPGEWVLGDPVDLSPGVYRLTVLNFFTRTSGVEHPLRVAWVRDGDTQEPAEIPDRHLRAATAIEPPVIEHFGQTVHPGFRFSIEAAYRLQNSDPTFIPVSFFDMTVKPTDVDLEYRWDFGDGRQAFGPNVTHVYTNSGIYRVRLEASEADSRRTVFERLLEVTPFSLRESRMDAGISGIPAALYERDRLNPLFSVTGEFHDRSLDVDWRITYGDGSFKTFATNGVPDPATTWMIPLAGDVSVADLREIAWQISHAGAGLKNGRMLLMRRPFPVEPIRVTDTRLWSADGDQMAWVANRGSPPWQAFKGPGDSRPGILWLTDIPDDFKLGDGLNVRAARAWRLEPDVGGSLVKFKDVADSLAGSPGTVVLGLGLADAVAGVDPAVFERQAAVLTDWILSQGQVRLLWVTPPPLVLPPVAARPYAAAVRRVADARGVEVVDLYSYFMGAAAHGEDLIKPPPLLGLTPAGRAAVVRLVSQTVMGTP